MTHFELKDKSFFSSKDKRFVDPAFFQPVFIFLTNFDHPTSVTGALFSLNLLTNSYSSVTSVQLIQLASLVDTRR